MKSKEREFEAHGLRTDGIHTNPIPNLHTHSELELNWVDRGWIEYTTMQGLQTLEAGQPVCFWGAFPHQILRMSEDLIAYWITVPHEIWLSWELPKSFRQDLLTGSFHPVGSVTLEQLHGWRQEVDAKSLNPALRRAMFLEMEACLLRSAGVRPPKINEGSIVWGEARQRHATNLVRIITDLYREDVTVGRIAEVAEISPEYATTVFRETMGISLKSYLTHLRVAHAQSLLLTTSKSITEIGYESGFNTPSRFYAAFAGSCQMTPKAYRRTHSVGL